MQDHAVLPGQLLCLHKKLLFQVYDRTRDIKGLVHARERPRVKGDTYYVDLYPLAITRRPGTNDERVLKAAVKVCFTLFFL